MSVAPQVLAALTAAANPDQQQRLAGEQQLTLLKANSQSFLSACTDIFVSAECPLMGRQLAGLQLKNAITAVVNASSDCHTATPFFQSNRAALQHSICLVGLQDPQRSVRNVAASITSWAVYANLWQPEETIGLLVNEIIAKQQQQQAGVGGVMAVQGAMRALSQIVADCVLLLESRQLVGGLVQAVLPFLTASNFFSAEFSQQEQQQGAPVNLLAVKEANKDAMEVRNTAFDVITTFLDRAAGDVTSATFAAVQPMVPQLIPAFIENVRALAINRYLYFNFAAKASGCLVGILVFHEGINDEVFQAMLHTMYEVTASAAIDAAASQTAGVYISEAEREKLGIEATGFWGTLLNVPRFVEQLRPALSNLIYHLIRQIKYSDFEMGMLSPSANDWQVPDKIDDVKPRHFEGKTQSTSQKKNKNAGNDSNGEASGGGVAEDSDDDDDDDDEVKEWNLRRVSAATLDELAECYGDSVIVPVLQCIEGMMQPGQPWKDLEAALLAFGAICDGCFDSLRPYLPTVAARFVQILDSPDSHFLVVNTALWALTQIGRYFVEGEEASEKEAFRYVMRLILKKMQSPSKLTQESASEALETMVELCGDAGDEAVAKLDPLSAEILSTIATCLGTYQLKNQVLLFEVLQTVCGVMGHLFQDDPNAPSVILTPLGNLWSTIPNDNPLVFSFFSCMGTVCSALGATVQPMAQQLFDRAYGMMSFHAQIRVTAYGKLAQQPHQVHQGRQSIMVFDEVPDENYLITATDLLSGLFDALGSSLEPLVAAQQPAFIQIVTFMATDAESYGIRQCAFALLGDLAKSCVSHVQRALAPIVQAVLQNLTEQVQKSGTRGHGDDDDDDDDGLMPVLSNIAWFLCNLIENQMELNDLPTLATIDAQTMPQIFHGLASTLCGIGAKGPSSAAENIVLCMGMLLSADPELEAKSMVPVSAYAAPFISHLLGIKDLPHRGPALQGFLLCIQHSPQGLETVVAHLTLFFDLAVRMKHDSPDLIRAMKQILTNAKQQRGQVWAQKMNSYGRAMKTQLYQLYGLN